MLRTITHIQPEPRYHLRVRYAHGEEVVADFSALVQRGGIFQPLGDLDFFAQVSLGPGGRFVTWPGEIDFCADALWLEGQESEQAVQASVGV